MHTPKFDWCHLMDELETNPMILQFRAIMKDSFPKNFAQCPAQVQTR